MQPLLWNWRASGSLMRMKVLLFRYWEVFRLKLSELVVWTKVLDASMEPLILPAFCYDALTLKSEVTSW